MTTWVIIGLVALWFVLSAGVVAFTCILSSRFNRQQPPEENAPNPKVALPQEDIEPIHSRVRVGT